MITGRPVERSMNLMAVSTASVPLSAMSTRVRLDGVMSTPRFLREVEGAQLVVV